MTGRSVRIREVGPRDGFQNEPEVISTDDKDIVEGVTAFFEKREPEWKGR